MLNLKDIEMIGKSYKIENASDPSKIGFIGRVIFITNDEIVFDDSQKIFKIKKNEIIKLKKIM
ncbi:MAG: hypothetical protein PHN22_01130 [Candidatus ainarchaeum sp.]|nr:hypothetical protein [Candidatus ainarchaeum sp.]